ncbi:C-X-C chemokine receptor type 3.1 [Brachionichthys hirsutus]|uniref:C-X-C chemokine receptor type 3.1 n=1 Tax=Brachionichthys hirsutus TaxID=412623 RepID=UPI00360451C7
MAGSDIITLTNEDLYGIFDNYSYDNFTNDCCDNGNTCDPNTNRNFEAVFIPVLYSVMFILGVLGNGLLLGVLLQSWKNWSVTDQFILHLGVADVLLLLTLPFWAAQAGQQQGWTFGTPLCKIAGAVFTINFYCGIFLLACISLERYMSIVHATQMYSRRKPLFVQLSCLAVWLFSLLLSLPDWIFLEAVKDNRRGTTECIRNYLKFVSREKPSITSYLEEDNKLAFQPVDSWRLASRLLYHIVGFLLPSAVLIFCYSCILQRLRCSSQGVQKQKAFRVIVAVVLVFFACWTPYNITLMVDTLHSNEDGESCGVRSSLEKAKAITSTVGYLHCSLNPILYAFVGVKFRRQLLDILRVMGCKVKTGVHSTVSSRRSSVWSESAETSNSIAI